MRWLGIRWEERRAFGGTGHIRRGRLGRRLVSSLTAVFCSLAAIIAPATVVRPQPSTTAKRELSSLASPANVFEAWGHSPDDRSLGPANPSSRLDVIFGLVLPPSDLAQFVQSVSQPGNPSYRHYEDVASLAAQTGATSGTSSALLSALGAYGVKGHLDPSGSYVEAGTTVAQASRLFGTSFGRYTFSLPSEDGVEVAPDATPHLPVSLRGRVNLVYGLKAVTQASVLPSSSFLTTTPTTLSLLDASFGGMGSPGGCARGRTYAGALSGGPMLTPEQYLTAYGVQGLHADELLGQGQAVAVLSYEPAHQSDLAAFGSCFGLPSPKLDNVRVGATPPPTALPDPDAQQEVALDTEMVAAMAPKLSGLDVVYGSVASGPASSTSSTHRSTTSSSQGRRPSWSPSAAAFASWGATHPTPRTPASTPWPSTCSWSWRRTASASSLLPGTRARRATSSTRTRPKPTRPACPSLSLPRRPT